MLYAFIIGNYYFIGTALCDNAVFLGYYNCARIYCRLIFHTCADDRILCYHQRNCLTLHVRTHQSTVCVIVLKERNHSRCYRYDHLRRYIHVVNACAVNFEYLFTVTGINTLSCESSLLVKRLVGLCHYIVVFNIGSHIGYFIKYNACLLVNLAVRSFDKAVLVYLCKRSKVGNKSDVRTFGSLDRTHSAVVGIVYISNLEACTVTGQTAGAECRKSSLMSKLGKGVVLIHEL